MPHSQSYNSRSRRIHVPGRPQTGSSQQSTNTPAHVQSGRSGTVPIPKGNPKRHLPDPAHLERMIDGLRRQARVLLNRYNALSAGAAELKKSELSTKSCESQTIREQVIVARKEAVHDAMEKFNLSLAEIRRRLDIAVETTAPGSLGCAADEIVATHGIAVYGTAMRVGSIETVHGLLPVLIPFVSERNWLLRGSNHSISDLLFNTLLRVSATYPLTHVRILVYDPRVSGVLAALAPLRTINGISFPPAYTSPRPFVDALRQAIQRAAENYERIAIGDAKSLIDLWNKTSVPDGVLTIAVILDSDTIIDDELLGVLHDAIEIGPTAGLSLVLHTSSNRFEDHPHFVTFDCDTRHLKTRSFLDGNPILRDPRIEPSVINKVFEQISSNVSSLAGPTYPLEEMINSAIDCPWTKSSIDSVDAIIGRSGNQELVLSFRSQNPPTPNLLIGGAVGQGKSNLLLCIIYSLACDYSPDELEMHLLDFKSGLEFKRFDKDADGRSWLPHVRVLSLESNQDFGVATLQYIEAEISRRSALFKEAGANAITDYRQRGNHLPRILLIIDEFHVLFEGEGPTTEEAVRLLEVLAKQGRAYGLHLLLASQTTSGISGLRLKSDSIFAQFPLRMSLKNTAQESQAILSQHNTAAADLTFRGEVIFNGNFGQDPRGSNVRAVTAWVNPERFAEVQAQLWEKGHTRPPMLFIGNEFATWDMDRFNSIGPRADGMIEAWLGRPIAITDCPYALRLECDTNQALAIVGTGEDVGFAVLTSFVVTAMKSMGQSARFVLLNGQNVLSAPAAELVRRVDGMGIATRIVDRGDVARYLVEEVGPILDDPSNAPTVIAGLSIQRIVSMAKRISTGTDDLSFDLDSPQLNSGNDVLERLCTTGALGNIFFAGWWSSLSGVTESLTYKRSGISKYLFLRTGLEDLREVAGPLCLAAEGYPRVMLFDKQSDEGLVTLVPFAPLPEMER